MIRRLLARFLPGLRSSEPRVYKPEQHPVRATQVSHGARTVTRRLQEAGFKAFIVGGAVRDLMLGIEPKDFDIATDARPEQVKPLFRRAYVIGRRFRLVHVHVGAEVVEVSTFRAANAGVDATDEHGRLLSDNVYGTQAEDAARRDFTVNALYFDPSTEEVWDFVGGVTDVRARRMKLIGPPVTRYREDPVRMLRAVRLAAKLGCTIEKRTAEPIPRLADLIRNVPAARLFDEMQKLLLSGHATETLASLRAHGLHHGLLPLIDVILEQPGGQRFIEAALANTDARVREGRNVSPAFLFATLLWHEVLGAVERREGPRRTGAARVVRRDGPRARPAGGADRRAAPLRGDDQGDLVAAAPLRAARGQPAVPLAGASALPRGVRLPAAALPKGVRRPQALADWWTRFQDASPDEREAMLKPDEAPKKRRRSRGRGRKHGDEVGSAGVAPAGDAPQPDDDER